jgi:hypothetical protein
MKTYVRQLLKDLVLRPFIKKMIPHKSQTAAVLLWHLRQLVWKQTSRVSITHATAYLPTA